MATKTTDFTNQMEEAKKLILDHESFLLVSHEYTDGDDLGAILALGLALEKLGKRKVLVAKGGVPHNLLFLPGQQEVKGDLSPYGGSPVIKTSHSEEGRPKDCEVLITLGCGDLGRTGFPELLEWKRPILNIDHHKDTKMFGTVNVWDAQAAANCELLYDVLKNWGIPIDKYTAQNLLTGIFTDTGGFRHANVSARTFEISAELLRVGAKLDVISRFTFSQKELPMLRAWSVALEHAKFDEARKIVYTVIRSEDLEKIQASEQDLEGVAELLNTIPEAKFSMLLKQRGDEIKGSLRSETHKDVDVSEIAKAFGGGGHKLAAGFKFKGKIEKTAEGWKIT